MAQTQQTAQKRNHEGVKANVGSNKSGLEADVFLPHGLNALLCSSSTIKRCSWQTVLELITCVCVLRVFNSNPKSEPSEEESEASPNTPDHARSPPDLPAAQQSLLLSAIRV